MLPVVASLECALPRGSVLNGSCRGGQAVPGSPSLPRDLPRRAAVLVSRHHVRARCEELAAHLACKTPRGNARRHSKTVEDLKESTAQGFVAPAGQGRGRREARAASAVSGRAPPLRFAARCSAVDCWQSRASIWTVARGAIVSIASIVLQMVTRSEGGAGQQHARAPRLSMVATAPRPTTGARQTGKSVTTAHHSRCPEWSLPARKRRPLRGAGPRRRGAHGALPSGAPSALRGRPAPRRVGENGAPAPRGGGGARKQRQLARSIL